MTQWLRVCTCLPEDLGMVASIHMAIHKCQRDPVTSSGLCKNQAQMWLTDIDTRKPFIYINEQLSTRCAKVQNRQNPYHEKGRWTKSQP